MTTNLLSLEWSIYLICNMLRFEVNPLSFEHCWISLHYFWLSLHYYCLLSENCSVIIENHSFIICELFWSLLELLLSIISIILIKILYFYVFWSHLEINNIKISRLSSLKNLRERRDDNETTLLGSQGKSIETGKK